MSTLPAVALDLSDFLRPSGFATEWVYGPARNDWLNSHPITAYADAEEGEPTVEFRGPLGLVRDEIPHLIAWLTAVHTATDPDGSEIAGHHALVASVRVQHSDRPDLLDGDSDLWVWGRDDNGEVGYVCVRNGCVLSAMSRVEVSEQYGPVTEQARPVVEVA